MTQLLVANVKLKMVLKLIQNFNPCVNNVLEYNCELLYTHCSDTYCVW